MARYFRNVPQVAWDFIDAAMPVKPTTIIFDDANGVANNLVAEDGSLAMTSYLRGVQQAALLSFPEAYRKYEVPM